MKSNASAMSMSKMRTWILMPMTPCTLVMQERLITARSRPARSRVLEHDALNDIRHVFAAVGDRFEMFVNGAQLDQFAHVRLLAKQPRDSCAHHMVGFRLEPIDVRTNRHDLGRIVHV